MKMMYCIPFLALILLGELVKGSCDLKIENSLLGDLIRTVLKLKGSDNGCLCINKKTTPAFSAILTKPQSLGVKDTIKFDKVVTNIQKGYNPSSGIFTAPLAGVYQFSSTVMTYSGQKLVVHLWYNNVKMSGVWLKGSAHESATINMVLQLQEGDQVTIKSRESNKVYSDSDNFTSFSGYLIAQ
ncbi:collagen alpha-2(VIII) chain-like [Mytilus californianus]|uniref:collagen alpha-2(VIII) chain-like n=1 Tax=Mytilus californianus TaxID=6549 RepID=UPI002245ADD5|nr:collagen alpha-2(VIII) chain-like [Mytilus californianus]